MFIRSLLSVLSVLCLFSLSCQEQNKPKTKEVLSPVFAVDKVYKSMQGPFKTDELTIVEEGDPDLIWITGFKSIVVDEDGDEQLSQEFMCHSNLRYRTPWNRRPFSSTRHRHGRIFTISQGQTEVTFPQGFGIPVMTNERLLLDNQMLNMNVVPANDTNPKNLRYKNVISYIKDTEMDQPMIPLYQAEAGIMVSLEGEKAYFNTLNPNEIQAGAMCSPGRTVQSKFNVVRQDRYGQKFTYHWILKPGKEVRHTLITPQLNLQFDTKIHYIAAHMHPYAESLALRDLTADTTLYTSYMSSFEDKIGLKKVDFFSSKAGIPVYKDHEYELVSTYNNTTDEDKDAMALIYLYLHDKRFQRRDN